MPAGLKKVTGGEWLIVRGQMGRGIGKRFDSARYEHKLKKMKPESLAAAEPGEVEALRNLHQGCFACGAANPVGLRLHFSIRPDGVAAARWVPAPAYRSYSDRVHGGVIATLIDSAIVHALFEKGVAGVTAELQVRYLQSVSLHKPVDVTGWVESVRHGIYHCGGEVHQEGRLVVRSSARFMAMSDPDGL